MKREFLNQLRLEKIEIYEKSCMNFANRQTVCSACVDICPTNAIHLEKQIPVINQGQCIDCGLCISQCNVYAIDHVQSPYYQINQSILAHPTANITCKQFEEYQKGIKVTCYLMLDIPLLMQFKNKKEITFHLDHCQTCHISEHIDVEKYVEQLQNQLKDLEIPIIIHMAKGKILESEDPVVDGLTRRELLKFLSVKNLRQLFLEDEEEKEKEPIRLDQKERLLYKKEIYQQWIQSNSQIKISLPENQFVKIEPIDRCRGCDICQEICPTKAISWRQLENIAELEFNAQACIACKKCVACPDKAINFQSISYDEYLESRKKNLISLTIKHCSECGQTFRTNQEVEVCEFCQSNQKDISRFFA